MHARFYVIELKKRLAVIVFIITITPIVVSHNIWWIQYPQYS